jgi:hypothetical protein
LPATFLPDDAIEPKPTADSDDAIELKPPTQPPD